MIPRACRLVISSTSPFIGRKFSSSFFTLITNPATAGPQWSVRISKRIDPRATARNRLRRQLNHWLYQHRSELKPQQFLLILRRKPEESDLTTLFEELKQFLYMSY